MNLSNYLIILDASRHGQTTSNLISGYMGGREPDVEMTPKGTQQIKELAKRYQQADIKLDLIYTSTMKRAIISADILAKSLGYDERLIRSTSDLDEIDMGQWAGKLRSEVCVGEALQDMQRLGNDFKGHGGESHNEVTERVRHFLNQCIQNAKEAAISRPLHIAAITHITTLRCLLNAIGARGNIQSADLAIYNGRTIRVCFNRTTERWELHGMNITELELKM